MKLLKSILVVLCIFGLGTAMAAPQQPGTWRCYAYNNSGGQWFGTNSNKAAAIAQAKQLCYSNSRFCRVPPASCTYKPVPRVISWKCVSQDRAGRTWWWNAPSKLGAIQNARRACRRNSNFPGSCSVAPGQCVPVYN